jgi:hypothetical protein
VLPIGASNWYYQLKIKIKQRTKQSYLHVFNTFLSSQRIIEIHKLVRPVKQRIDSKTPQANDAIQQYPETDLK